MWGPYGLQIIDTLQVYLCICQKRSGVFIAPLTFTSLTNHHLHMADPPCPPAICSWCCWGCGCQCSSGSPPSSGWLCARMALGLWRVNTSEDIDDWHTFKEITLKLMMMMVVVVMLSLLSTGLVELLRHHHRRLIWRLDFDNAPIITNDYHHCQYHGLVKTKFTKSNILLKKIADLFHLRGKAESCFAKQVVAFGGRYAIWPRKLFYPQGLKMAFLH